MDALSPEGLSEAHRNLVEATWEFLRRFPQAHREHWPGVSAFRSRVPVPESNQLILADPPGDPEALLTGARRFFRPGYPFEVLSPVGEGGDPFLRFPPPATRNAPRLPGMWMDLSRSFPAPPPTLSVLEVAEGERLREFRKVMGTVYRIPGGLLRTIFPASRFREEDPAVPVRLYLGCAAGRPVAGSVLVVTGRTAGIYWVATDPRHRRRGYGEAVTWAGLAGGEELGARVGFLPASPLGRPVYEHMGFRTGIEYLPWQPRRDGLQRARTAVRMLGIVLASAVRRDRA